MKATIKTGKVMTAEAAVAEIATGATIASVGVIGWVTPDRCLAALGQRHRDTGAPSNLTLYLPVGTGDAMEIKGMDHLAQEGMLKRIVSGSYINPVNPKTGQRPELMRLIRENKIEAYSWPIGASMHWLREVARKSPGYLTSVGQGTYIDPEHGGGKFTERAKDDLVRAVTFEGQRYLFYPTWKIDVAFIRASTADEFGNLSWEDEALVSSSVALALAVKACGGRVIAQVRRVVPRGSRQATQVPLPGVLVDAVVIDEEQMMVTQTPFDASYLGGQPMGPVIGRLPRMPFAADKIVAWRAAQETRTHELSILGFGASSDMPLVMAETGQLNAQTVRDYWFTTEHGSYGGVVMSGWQFSANVNPEAILDGLSQFDLIDAGLCEFAALAFAEFDSNGVVNVSRFGTANPGAGGFIDIAENAKRLVFCGTFTTGGLEVRIEDGQLQIVREGRQRKFVAQASHITYRVTDGVADRAQEATIITERAVFRVDSDGLTLTEIAPGIDIQTQVLDQMDFRPVRIAPDLRRMDLALFARQTHLVAEGLLTETAP
ncbi:propionate CoA-transferase [Variovorax sp. KBS0712]|uniref:acyl CoA:acetate/3-ketoacid CoA transferase n=1 Tax=Variovorax sp. KBS0712 TaxID=2578111 RepID=UPI001117FA80|nr:CoA-transferase [Variovorax sp. KBS0712]TSD57069.1 propionate CoA-transferase [Variovorax sp. KBS0712]